MRQYELVAIFPSEEELFRQGKEAVAAELAKQGAAEVKETDMGDRLLAYSIKKKDRGHYILFTMNLDPQKVTPAERIFKLNPNLLKYLFVKVEA
ncbi:MAG TPA: 30S ribosomal protein S6 [Spirochaetia bacterium]|nr:30S ribosomal protein S6 [Spirochaetia bacterium]